MAGIIWLASYQKSGNTWVRAFLANFLRNPRQPIPINDLPNYAFGDGFLIHFQAYCGRPPGEMSEQELFALRPKIHAWFADSSPDSVFVKTHNARVKVDGQPLITPDVTAGAVYVVRNPLDLAVSFAHHHRISIQQAVDLLCDESNIIPASEKQLEEYLLSWSSHVRSWLAAPGIKVHCIRFEDMLAAPVETFGRLLDFLGLPKPPDRLEKAINFSSFDELARQETQERFVESRPDGKSRFFREGKAGIWRQALTGDQVRRLIEAHGEVMRELGYLNAEGEPIP